MARSDVRPFLAMVVVQMSFAGLNIASKLAMNSGMKPLVLVTYRQIFATFALTPFAYFFEWKTRPKITIPLLFQLFLCSFTGKTRPKITIPLLFQLFLCSLTGITGNQVFYFVGLEKSTSTVGCALNNILPATTFILAVLFRQETLGLKKIFGQAKVLGTAVSLGGAMLLSFYHGKIINLGNSSIQWSYAEKMGDTSSTNKTTSFLGPLFVMAGAASSSVWFIIQAKVSSKFSAPCTSTLLMCLIGSIEVMAIAAFHNHELSLWSLRSPGRLFAALYAGIVCSGLSMCLISWSISRKGALYVSVFSPLSLVIVAVLSWALMHEYLYIGTGVGSLMIVGGLYAVLWGKDKEAKLKNSEDMESIESELVEGGQEDSTTTATKIRTIKGEKDDDDLDLQLPAAAAVVTNPINNNGSNIIEN